jgi:hypothetical protein
LCPGSGFSDLASEISTCSRPVLSSATDPDDAPLCCR